MIMKQNEAINFIKNLSIEAVKQGSDLFSNHILG
jgi:hypothetical protein